MNGTGPFDEKSLELLFRSHYRPLYRFAMSYVKTDEDAREIVQDAFVSLWERRHTLDLSKSVKSYLSTTVRNKCLNHLRDNRKFSRELMDLENLREEAAYEQPDNLVEREIREKIESSVEELPGKCREIFILSRHHNLKYQEIADRLQISVKTVETQMSKALQHLRHRLAEYLPAIILFIFAASLPHYLAISDPQCAVRSADFLFAASSPHYLTISLFHHFTIFFPIRVTAFSCV